MQTDQQPQQIEWTAPTAVTIPVAATMNGSATGVDASNALVSKGVL